MATDKRTKLSLIEKHPDFMLQCMEYGANHMLQQLLSQDLIKKGRDGKRPNRAAVHPMILHALRRDVELQLEVPNG